MRVIAHLSDLHFGRLGRGLLAPLRAALIAAAPDVVAVSGDLTQRARPAQFREARQFLDSLGRPWLAVPGNHDVPLYDLVRRFLSPLDAYCRHLHAEPEPSYVDDEVVLLGLNTTRSFTVAQGRVNRTQLGELRRRLQAAPAGAVRFVVSHHPFDLPAHLPERAAVGRARLALESLAGCGVDVFLAGHFHTAHTLHAATRLPSRRHHALVVQAGTACSSRVRTEVNSFNVLRVTDHRIVVERHDWRPQSGEFGVAHAESFARVEHGWVPA